MQIYRIYIPPVLILHLFYIRLLFFPFFLLILHNWPGSVDYRRISMSVSAKYCRQECVYIEEILTTDY